MRVYNKMSYYVGVNVLYAHIYLFIGEKVMMECRVENGKEYPINWIKIRFIGSRYKDLAIFLSIYSIYIYIYTIVWNTFKDILTPPNQGIFKILIN